MQELIPKNLYRARREYPEEQEVAMLCAELEQLEAELNEIIAALEDETITDQQRTTLQQSHARLSRIIRDHQSSGHEGGPCFEE